MKASLSLSLFRSPLEKEDEGVIVYSLERESEPEESNNRLGHKNKKPWLCSALLVWLGLAWLACLRVGCIQGNARRVCVVPILLVVVVGRKKKKMLWRVESMGGLTAGHLLHHPTRTTR